MALCDVKNEENLRFYTYTVFLNDESEREESRIFLKSWIKFFMRSLPKESVYIDSCIVERPKMEFECLTQNAHSSIKLCIELDKNIPVRLQNGEMRVNSEGIEYHD
jgi:hypothetical protein